MARTATVVGEEITLEPPFETAGQPVPLDTGVWQVNSERVMQIFLENGGYDFINREAELSVIMNLDLATANSQPEWLVSAISTRSDRSLSMWINATSGEIINSAADS